MKVDKSWLVMIGKTRLQDKRDFFQKFGQKLEV